ncbi:MAG: SDR family NAD(P)-dependent oxidoreductase [Planctomycetota bacterium]
MSQNDPTRSCPVAIVGISCLFPKADGLGAYWANVRRGVDGISEVPETHWKVADYFDADPKKPDHTYAQRGGFLSKVAFDPLRFGIAPNDVEATDTSQLLGLVTAQRALEDAGYGASRDFDRERVSVLLGVTGTLELTIPLGARLGHPFWRRALEEAGVDAETSERVIERIADQYVGWKEMSFPGLLGNVVAGRIANKLDLHGTNAVVDAACASSLSALHLSLMELESGRSDLAISGGVDTFNDIFMYMCFSKTPALSKTGNARPFSKTGDGTILGEGLGMVVLKRLEDAERDGDTVYAVIKGMGTSSDGKGKAIYAPSAEGQMRALRDAYRVAGVTPDTIELVEAHGTGTIVGDATEIRALTQVYRDAKPEGTWCAVGSVKSQIGHTKAAAGVAGLIKAAMALHHKVLPPTLKVDAPIDELEAGQSPFYLNREAKPWMPRANHPRRAAVSAFGFGGSNFHCVLEEHSKVAPGIDWDGTVQIVAFSAPDRAGLREKLRAFDPGDDWRSLHAAAAASRETFHAKDRARLLLVVERERSDIATLIRNADERLSSDAQQWSTPSGLYFGEGETSGSLGVLFPGQGSQYPGMLRDLACQFPEMQDALAKADAIVTPDAEVRLSDRIYPASAFDDATREQQDADLRATEIAQPAIGAVSLGAYRILESFGIEAQAVAGHSYGELAALAAAGVLSDEDFLTLSRQRGELMGAAHDGDPGAMLAVESDAEALEEIAREEGLDVVVANKNAPRQSVLSGPTAEIERAEEVLEKRSIRKRRLPVAAAFHSTLVAQASQPFQTALETIKFARAKIDVFANSTAELYPAAANKAREILAEQLARPVEFVREIENLYKSGVRAFLEVGPGARLTGLVKAILEDLEHHALALDASGGRRAGVSDLAKLLAIIAALGYSVHLSKWDPEVEPATTGTTENTKLSLEICGANYRSPLPDRPPAPPASPPPVREKTYAENTNGEAPAKTPSSGPARPAAAPTFNAAAPSRPAPEPRAERPNPSRASSSDPRNRSMDSDLRRALRAGEEGLARLHELYQRTADLHRDFLEGQREAQKGLQQLLGQQQKLWGSATPGDVPLASPTMPASRPASATPQPPPARTAEPVTPPPQASNGHVEAAPATPPPRAVASSPAAPPPKAPASSLVPLLLEVVSEKTGYPEDALDLDMELDADLGIDSIKRVEILSALQERSPELPTLSSDEVGRLRSLQDVVSLMGDAPPTGVPRPAPNGALNDLAASLLEIVSEKTGYPQDALDLDMELDADLGIDSIKRVEILSAVQERHTGLTAIESDALGALRSLRDVLGALGTAEVQAPVPVVTAVDATDIATELLAIVSEKTGYPQDALDLDMELDADLGIDSIKRVEILSAVQEARSELRAVDSDALGSLRSLRDVLAALTPEREPGWAPVTAAPNAGVEVTRLVMQTVAEKTGYPEDALDLDMELDADLGIDSIKRVEILSAVQEAHAELRAVDSDALGALRTLRDVVSALQGAAPANAVSSAPHVTTSAATLIRSAVQDLPWTPSGEASPLAGTLWIVGHGPVAESLCDRARSLDIDVVLHRSGQHPDVPSDLRSLIFVAPDDPTEADLFEAVSWLQTAGRVLRERNGSFATVTRIDGRFGLAETREVISGGFAGLTKTVDREWPELRARAFDVAPQLDPEAAAGHLLEQLSSEGPVELGLDATGWHRLVERPIESVNGSAVGFEPGDAIVISGGARGVTAAAAIALAERFRPTLLLLGRTPLTDEPEWLERCLDEIEVQRAWLERHPGRSPKEARDAYRKIAGAREVRQTLEAIRQAGARAEYVAVDIRDAASVREAIDHFRRSAGPIRGLIHGAGVLADQRIEDKSEEAFSRVLGTKLDGARALLAATEREPLRGIALFSSSTARYGRTGQVDYAIANEILNKLAWHESRRRTDCRVVSLNWGPWDGGMVTPGLKRLFESEGVGLIPLKSGAELLAEELTAPSDRAVEIVVLARAGDAPVASAPETDGPAASQESPEVDRLAFEIGVDVGAFPVLRSHVLDGRGVVPLALMMEWFGHAALQHHPGYRLGGLDELRVFQGLKIRRGVTVSAQVWTGPAEIDADGCRVPVELRSEASPGRSVLHARGTAVLVERHASGEPASEAPALRPYPHDAHEIYSEFLFHGQDLRGIARVEGCSESGIVAETSGAAPAPAEWIRQPMRGQWLTDPLAIDSAFQLLILWTLEQFGAGSLPCHAASYRQFQQRFPDDGVRIVARIRSHTEHAVHADIEILDREGRLVARFEDYESVVDVSLERAFRSNQLA